MSELQPSEILLTADQIQTRVSQLALDIDRDAPAGVHLVGVLKGGFVFLADLIRQIQVPTSVDFIALASYGDGTTSSGEVQLVKDLSLPIDGRPVVIVEDIVDTGRTLVYLQRLLRARRPASLRTACLLSKPSRREVDVPVEYIGFEIADCFAVGYGLDCAERFRNLPHIAVIAPIP
jgi:hypoxanthine phosphoribosyltransferase